MGGCCSCFKDSRTKEGDITINFTKDEQNRVILLQSLLRGFIDRKKAVEFSRLKYHKKNKSRNNKKIN